MSCSTSSPIGPKPRRLKPEGPLENAPTARGGPTQPSPFTDKTANGIGTLATRVPFASRSARRDAIVERRIKPTELKCNSEAEVIPDFRFGCFPPILLP